MRGSDFAELKAFIAVVERQSFARAAEHLGLSPSALSQTIRQLETRIGARLLNRTTRSVAPSASGEQLYRRVAPLFREMADAVAEASDATGQMSGTLRINTLGIAARTIIGPRLGRFHRAHPDVVLDIVVDDALADIVTGRFDAGIRVGGRLEKDMVAVRLTPDLKMVAVASPDYLAQYGTPKSPADLHDHQCVNWRLQMDGRFYRWEFEKRGKRLEVAVDGPVVTNHADIGVAAALNGLGIAYHFELDQVGELLAQGRLVQVLADWSVSRPGLFLYYSNRQHRPALLGSFIDCLLDRGAFGQHAVPPEFDQEPEDPVESDFQTLCECPFDLHRSSPPVLSSHKQTGIATVLDWLKKKLQKSSVLKQIAESETTHKHRDAYDSAAQHAIRERMKELCYRYVGKGGAPDAEDPSSYSP